MKLSLTKQELLKVLSDHFKLDVVDFVMLKAKPPVVTELEAKLAKEMEIVPAVVQDYVKRPDKKIHSIKALRAITGLCLADSKWAIENWDKYFGFVVQQKRLPSISMGGGYDERVLS
jgi:ribosomal protein L7/L12